MSDTVLDTAPLGTTGMSGLDVSGLGAVFEPQEAHDVVRGESTYGVVEQVIEDVEEASARGPHEVSRDLAGVDAPVVGAEALVADHAEPGVDAAGEGVEKSAPPPADEAAAQPLGKRQVIDAQEGVLVAVEVDPRRSS